MVGPLVQIVVKEDGRSCAICDESAPRGTVLNQDPLNRAAFICDACYQAEKGAQSKKAWKDEHAERLAELKETGERIFRCDDCDELWPESELVTVRECSRCDEVFNGTEEVRNCPSCNCPATRRLHDRGCPDCASETECEEYQEVTT